MMNEVDDTVNNIISDFDGMDDATKAALSAATNLLVLVGLLPLVLEDL